MKYFLIAGEASGDLHAAHLMQALRAEDAEAEFRFYGGDEMQKVGGTMLCHYRELAYMGFIPVLLHLRTILRGMSRCKRQMAKWNPDVLILVDYPGFNLKMARFAREHALCPVYYYISPKIWAWKEHRIHAIRRDVDRLFSILPFEVDFFEKKHHYPVSYVGNPTVDEVDDFLRKHPIRRQSSAQPQLALLPGSREQEVTDNLSRMLQAVRPLAKSYGLKCVVAQAQALPDSLYHDIIKHNGFGRDEVELQRGRTYEILYSSTAALVTSGTATLETALFRVPQVVCYYMPLPRLMSFLRRHFLKVPFISLVNLVCGSEVVSELVGADMRPDNIRQHLEKILPGHPERQLLLEGYEEMARKLGLPGAPQRAAREMVQRMKELKSS